MLFSIFLRQNKIYLIVKVCRTHQWYTTHKYPEGKLSRVHKMPADPTLFRLTARYFHIITVDYFRGQTKTFALYTRSCALIKTFLFVKYTLNVFYIYRRNLFFIFFFITFANTYYLSSIRQFYNIKQYYNDIAIRKVLV